MKRFLFILPITIATLSLIVFSIIPHHHHKEMLCIVMETCEQDNAVNDEHTNHNTDGNTNHEKTCVLRSEYITTYGGGDNLALLPVLFLLANYLIYNSELSNTESTYGEYVFSYTSVMLGESSGLRAPPCFLS